MSTPPAVRRPPGTVQLVSLTAALAWILLHVGHAVAFRDQHREPALLGLAVVLALAADAVALAPLFRRQEARLHPGVAVALALAAVAVAACVQPFLDADAISGYANWPMGGMSVLVAALTLRHRAGAAALAVLGMTLVNSVSTWQASEADASVTLTDGVFLAVSPATWWVAAFLVRSALDRSTEITQRYRRRQLDLDAQEHVSEALQRSDDDRRTELRIRVLPLLHRVRDSSEPIDSDTRAEARAAALSLRDDLRARSLLTRSLRQAVAEARARGVWVSLSCDAGVADDLVRLTRSGLLAALPATSPGSTVSCRVTGTPAAAVVVLSDVEPEAVGALGSRFAHEAVALPGAEVAVDELDQELVVHLRVGT